MTNCVCLILLRARALKPSRDQNRIWIEFDSTFTHFIVCVNNTYCDSAVQIWCVYQTHNVHRLSRGSTFFWTIYFIDTSSHISFLFDIMIIWLPSLSVCLCTCLFWFNFSTNINCWTVKLSHIIRPNWRQVSYFFTFYNIKTIYLFISFTSVC